MPAVSKSMPSASSASNPVSDALTTLTRAATVALNTVQEQAQTEVAHARAERDDALRALHEAQLDAKDLEAREEGWRAALEKSDLTIKHQAETIERLRNEVDQWKVQLTRLEESSRQEIEDWKDQYRRAENERTRLSSRVDELIAGQLAWNATAHVYNAPYTPRMPYADIPEPSTSLSSAKRASTARRTAGVSGRPHPDTDEVPRTAVRRSRPAGGVQVDRDLGPSDPHTARPSTSRRREQPVADVPRASGSKSTPRASHITASPARRESQPYSEPRQRVIRRVTAIVDVKEEDEDEELGDHGSAHSGSVYEPEEDTAPAPRRPRLSHPSARRKRVVQDWDEDEQTPDVGDDDEGEEPEAEDDELLLGAGAKKSKLPGGHARPRANGTGKQAGTGRTLKRKIDVDGAAPSGRAGTAKAAKTR
ncbi:hypothetical protein C8Q77DRAFT_1125451 [Trametes polyzona]|nr:hypothetical protein C8Q77DRAFT_1125451 [Trametes polyzona]